MSAQNPAQQEVPTRWVPIVSVLGLIALLAVGAWMLFASDFYEEGGRFQREIVPVSAPASVGDAPAPDVDPPARYQEGAPNE